METKNSPLALNSWADMTGPNSYGAALRAIYEVLDQNGDTLREHPALADFIEKALYNRVTSQSQANYEQFSLVESNLTEGLKDYVQGKKSPAELVLFLHVTDKLQSIETARRTHLDWNVYPDVDRPVRSDLDDNPILYTQAIKSEPLYRIKNLNVVNRSDNYFVQIDRKRTIRQHFGGNVLTVVRNSLVLHNRDGSMPREIREYIRGERSDAMDRSNHRDLGDYDYDKHSEVLHAHLEEHILNRKTSEKPTWAMPILTTYYAARREAMKGRLLEFDSVATQEIT